MIEAGRSPHIPSQVPSLRALRLGLNRLTAGFESTANRERLRQALHEKAEERSIAEFQGDLDRMALLIARLQKAHKWGPTYFNLFEVIERTRCEQTHSNVLAWLLRPEEAHGLGSAFLRAFMKTVFGVALNGTTGVEVTRECPIENGQCDVVITLSGQWILVIENKVWSSEGDQTIKYAQYWRTQWKRPYLVYLTRDGTQPKSKHFKPVSYQTV